MNKTSISIIVIAIIIGFGIIFFSQYRDNSESTEIQSSQNVEMRDGIQYVIINARGGYSPKASSARANIPTKLIVKTNGTYDCSASLVIRSIGYQKVLSQTGEEVINLGAPQAGTLQGLCSMGMYSFSVNFI
jgi:plastocyanin domain-containing protein